MAKFQSLSDSEMAVMKVIWRSPHPVTSSELLKVFSESKGWKSQTISTFLSRLTEKGMLKVAKKGAANYYQVAVTQEEYRKQETQSFLENIHGGSVQSFIATLYDLNDITPEDIEELKHWLDKR